MSRFRRVVHSVASGYAALGATAVYSLAILPLGLHYLSEARMGLWTLMASISGYLSLIDLGMSGSLARLIIDYKDEKTAQSYGSLMQTGWIVLMVQGLIIAVAGFVLAPLLTTLLKIEDTLRPEFVALIRWQTIALATSFFTRIFSHILQAHQRLDLINYSQILNLIISFLALWAFFDAGYGVFSLAWATVLGTVISNGILFLACRQLSLFPAKGSWGQPSWTLFRDIFAYGKDMFLVAVGAQLIMTSQTLIITRQLGVAACTLWYAGTRVFNLVSQAIWRISDVSMPAFSEMMVRREDSLLKERYKTILVLTASLSAFCAVSYALSNNLFVLVWTSLSKKQPLAWPPHNDVLLAVWMIILAVLHCHNSFVLTTKRVGFMRYVFFVEGTVFVVAAALSSKRGGMVAIIFCSIFCSTMFSGAYGVWRISDHFRLPIKEVGFRWMIPMVRVLVFFGGIGGLTWRLSKPISDPNLRLGIHILVCGCAGLFIFLRFGLPAQIQAEVVQRAPRPLNLILKRCFASVH